MLYIFIVSQIGHVAWPIFDWATWAIWLAINKYILNSKQISPPGNSVLLKNQMYSSISPD